MLVVLPESAKHTDSWFLSAAESPTALLTLSAGSRSLYLSRATDGAADGGDMKLMEEQLWPLLKQHLQQSLTYWSVFFSFGLCTSFLGPTILDLRCQTGATAEQITWVFFSQQFFLLLGSCLGGIFKKR